MVKRRALVQTTIRYKKRVPKIKVDVSEPFDLLNLPDELIVLTITSLDIQDRIAVGSACKRLHIICSDLTYWKKQVFQIYNRLSMIDDPFIHPEFEERAKEVAISLQYQKCFGCKIVYVSRSNIYQLIPCYICYECQKSKAEFQLIHQTEAIRSFKLKAEQLRSLKSLEKRNGYSSYGVTRLFRKVEAHRLAIQIHGSEENLQNLIKKSQERARKMLEKKMKSKKEES